MTKAPGGDISVKVGGIRVVLERDVNYALRVEPRAAGARGGRARARAAATRATYYVTVRGDPLRRRSSRRAAPYGANYGADYARGAVGLDVTRRRTCHPRPQRTARGRPPGARGAQEPQPGPRPGPDARPARRPPESFRDVEEENSVEVLKC